jgi:RNA polymerase sigma-B factor
MATAPAARAKPKDDAQHSGRILLRMPPALHNELAQAAEREGTSLNAYITQTLSKSLSDDERPHAPGGPSRFIRIAVIVDLVMVAAATVAAVALLIVAWS